MKTHHILVWGWLRFFLGTMQISFAAAGIWLLLHLGLRPITLQVYLSAFGYYSP